MLSIALLIPPVLAQAPAKTAKRRRSTAEEVSRQFLSAHPKPRDEAEKADYLKQLLPLVRTGGLIVAHDSSGQADQMQEMR